MTQQTCSDFSIYLDNSRAKNSRTAAYLFQDPLEMIVAAKSSDIHNAFDRIKYCLDDGYYLAGWISYETGLFLEGKLNKLGDECYKMPFISLGVYKKRLTLSSADSEDHWAAMAHKGDYGLGEVALNISRTEYETAVAKIQDYLKAGDIYQVNFTLKSLFNFTGRPESYFAAMRHVQRVEYGAFLKSDDLSVLSLSPELFFQKTGPKIMTRPMKGTFPRGRNGAEDRHNADFMQNDEKNRAENLMIVDLLRNDLSRISVPGSVKLKSLYDVEKYRTLFQMTSTIESEVSDEMTIVDLIKALFPCGSVTGAPKIRAMEIISELEVAPRGKVPFLKSDDLSVLSLSPELFFQKTGPKIMTRPMKGTFPRGRNGAEDRHNADFMQNDEKNRAENLMIVDLLRNDLSRISVPGSVKLKSLYDVEKYRTLFQMTSTIESEVSDEMTIVDLIKALFPCGSVTGAPKIRAMEIISELEVAPRGIYTGAIGFMAPDGDCCFSVPIRTVTIDRKGRGEMGIGSAIVADSNAASEYDECLLKAQFATGEFRKFDLIESLRWSADEGYYLLDLHLNRLEETAEYFDFICDKAAILQDLENHAEWLDPEKAWKVRLLVSQTGEVSITSLPINKPPDQKIGIITLSDKIVNSQNPLLFHKTTDREFYHQELSRHQTQYGSYDVVFINEKGSLTGGAYNNIFLKLGDSLQTPALEAGLLAGTLRQSMIKDSTINLIITQLSKTDLLKAEKIYMGNSVRGLVEVVFKDPLL